MTYQRKKKSKKNGSSCWNDCNISDDDDYTPVRLSYSYPTR